MKCTDVLTDTFPFPFPLKTIPSLASLSMFGVWQTLSP
jgi:hypothetical protein